MPTEGPKLPSGGFAFTPWTAVARAFADDTTTDTDDANASVGPAMTSASSPSTSSILRVTGFNFNLPADANIINVVFRAYGRRIQQAAVAPAVKFQLYAAGAKGSTKSAVNDFSNIYEAGTFTEVQGHPDTYWGYGALSVAEVNASTFGVNIQYGPVVGSGTEQIGINYVEAFITYLVPTIGGGGMDKDLIPYIITEKSHGNYTRNL